MDGRGTIDFYCTQCGAKISAPEPLADQQGRCGKCGHLIAPPRSPRPARTSSATARHHFDSKGRPLGADGRPTSRVAKLAPIGWTLITLKMTGAAILAIIGIAMLLRWASHLIRL
jgi:DNA-directed RNA polymerase subunit RPC12/RpoP